MKRLLVRLPNWLGDFLLARPLLHALRATFPSVELAGVGPPSLVDLLSADRVLDRYHEWPAGAVARGRLVRELRGWGPDAGLALPPSFSSAWFLWRTGAPTRVGFRGDGRSPLLTHALPRPARGDRHLSEEYLSLGASLGARPAGLPVLDLPARAHEPAEALLAVCGFGGRPFALLGPGAIFGPAKRWAAARFAELGRRFVASGWNVLACGTPSERETCETVARAIGTGAVSVAGRTDLLTQAALCARAGVAVCNDSGLAHLSAAVGAPTVVIFGSTSSAWTAPAGGRVRVVQDAPVCSPCFQRTCRIGYVCLEAVTVDRVEHAAREVAA